MVPRTKHDSKWFYLLFCFFFIHSITALISDDPLKGIIYSGWIIFTYFTFFRLAVDCARRLGPWVWEVLIINGRFQIITAIALVAIGVHERAKFGYYEPSYMAVGLIPYIFAATFLSKRKLLDATLVVLILVFSQSANLILVIVIGLFCWLFLAKFSLRTIVALAAVILVFSLLLTFTLRNSGNPNFVVVNLFLENGISLDTVITGLERGGNRVPRIEAAWEVAKKYLFTGVGSGNYVQYTNIRNYSHISDGKSWLDPSGLPAVNVLLEAVTNAGLLAALLLVLIYYFMWHHASKHPDKLVRYAILCGLLAIAIVMQLESNYMRAYLWVAFGLYVAHSGKISETQINNKHSVTS